MITINLEALGLACLLVFAGAGFIGTFMWIQDRIAIWRRKHRG